MTWVDPLLGDYRSEWEENQRAPVEAFPTPWESLNLWCGDAGGRVGIARGWNVTLGGTPGSGKSVLALNLAASAMMAGQRVAFCSLEMSAEQLSTRLYSIVSGINIGQLQRGDRFDPAGLGQKLEEFMAASGPRAGLYINTEPLSDIEDVMRHLEYLVTEASPAANVVIIDYIQLISTGDEDSISRATTEVATRLRLLAHRHKVVVIGLSQYNRQTSANKWESPTPQSLFGGMALEAGSDMVLLLDHSRYERDGLDGRTWLICGKNRHGGSGEIPIKIDYRTLKTSEALPHEEDQWPKQAKRG